MSSFRVNKVGSRGGLPSSTALKVDAGRRFKTMASATSAPDVARQGVLAGLLKFEALKATVETLEAFEEITMPLSRLASVVMLAKHAVRNRKGVTPGMQEDLRQILAFHAKWCSAAMVDGDFKNKEDEEIGMIFKEIILRVQIGPFVVPRYSYPATPTAANTPPTPPPVPRSRADSSNSPPPPPRTRANSVDPTSPTPSRSGSTSASVGGGAMVVYSPPVVQVVLAGQPVVAGVDLLAAILPGSVTVGRWCSSVLGVCVARARSWW